MIDFLEHYQPGGFFYEARKMNFNVDLADKLVSQLVDVESMEKTKDDYVSVIKKIWKFPFTMAVYKDRCISGGANEKQYDEYLRRIYEIVERIVESQHGPVST